MAYVNNYAVELVKEDFEDTRLYGMFEDREYIVCVFEIDVVPGSRGGMFDPGYTPYLEVDEAAFEDQSLADELTDREQNMLLDAAWEMVDEDNVFRLLD